MINRDDYLMLSGIQHFAFCKRQWSLIHIEKLWEENTRTFGGSKMHEKADNPFILESRGSYFISRGMPIYSDELKFYGVADVVEFHKSDNGIMIPNKDGLWNVTVVEYKYGQEKENDIDDVQLMAQAICLEEMFKTYIDKGYIFYGKTKRRKIIEFTDNLRNRVIDLAEQMWDCFEKGITYRAELHKHCKNCSLKNLCMPEISSKVQRVKNYINKHIAEGDGYFAKDE